MTTRGAYGLALIHSILAFIFNTSILALGINVGASLVSGCPWRSPRKDLAHVRGTDPTPHRTRLDPGPGRS